MTTKRFRGISIQIEVGARLAAARRAAKLSQTRAGAAIGMSRAGYGHFETGSRSMLLDDLVRLAETFNVSPAHLLGTDGELTPDEARLLAAYRAIETEPLRRLFLAVVVQAGQFSRDPPAS